MFGAWVGGRRESPRACIGRPEPSELVVSYGVGQKTVFGQCQVDSAPPKHVAGDERWIVACDRGEDPAWGVPAFPDADEFGRRIGVEIRVGVLGRKRCGWPE